MKRVIIRSSLLLVTLCALGCAEVERTPVSPYDEARRYDMDQLMEAPYGFGIDMEKSKDGIHHLVVNMDLAEGAFFLSPHSSSGSKGRFSVTLDDNDLVILDSMFTETPRSVQVFDSHRSVAGPVNRVKEDTRYAYPLYVVSQDDFEVFGMISFTIEPRCTFEQIPFTILQRNGKLTVKTVGC